MVYLLIRGGVQGGRWDGLQGERDRAGRRREARAPAAGAVREVVDGRETSHATESETLRWLTSSKCRPRGQEKVVEAYSVLGTLA